MDQTTVGAVYPNMLKTSTREFKRNIAGRAYHLPDFTMPLTPRPNREDLLTLTAALNHMSVHNALLPGGGEVL